MVLVDYIVIIFTCANTFGHMEWCCRVVWGAGRKAKRMVLQCINGVSSNPVEGRTKILQL